MNSKAILGISIAAVFAISMMVVPALASGHLTITSSSIKSAGNTFKVSITTAAPIDTTAGAFGYGVVGTGGVLAITTHGGVGPDSDAQKNQQDDVMHTHVVTVGAVPGCPDGLGVTSIDAPDLSGVAKVKDNTLKVTAIPANSPAGTLTGPFASFNLSVIGDPAAPTAVCVNDLTFFP